MAERVVWYCDGCWNGAWSLTIGQPNPVPCTSCGVMIAPHRGNATWEPRFHSKEDRMWVEDVCEAYFYEE